MERAELNALLHAAGVAERRGEFTFLCGPEWTEIERAETEKQMSAAALQTADPRGGWLNVRTGGSSGGVKFARHDESTLSAAVRGFCAHFGLARVNAVDVLPAHHVSGLMTRVRCAMTGGKHVAWDWKRMEAGELPVIDWDEWVLSLVPTQLQRLLGSPRTVEWLKRLRILFVGGGPVWLELADAAAAARLRVSLTYGMTETAAMVAALQPDEFLAGARSSGAMLPHARVTIDAADNAVTITGESMFRGYWPEWRETREFTTEDIGRIDEHGHVHIVGRRDAMIITGGKKVNAIEIEAALRATGEFADVVVIGLPDREWGEVVVACYPSDGTSEPNLARATEGLASYQRPKRFVAIAPWPRNAQGKVNRAALRAVLRGDE